MLPLFPLTRTYSIPFLITHILRADFCQGWILKPVSAKPRHTHRRRCSQAPLQRPAFHQWRFELRALHGFGRRPETHVSAPPQTHPHPEYTPASLQRLINKDDDGHRPLGPPFRRGGDHNTECPSSTAGGGGEGRGGREIPQTTHPKRTNQPKPTAKSLRLQLPPFPPSPRTASPAAPRGASPFREAAALRPARCGGQGEEESVREGTEGKKPRPHGATAHGNGRPGPGPSPAAPQPPLTVPDIGNEDRQTPHPIALRHRRHRGTRSRPPNNTPNRHNYHRRRRPLSPRGSSGRCRRLCSAQAPGRLPRPRGRRAREVLAPPAARRRACCGPRWASPPPPRRAASLASPPAVPRRNPGGPAVLRPGKGGCLEAGPRRWGRGRDYQSPPSGQTGPGRCEGWRAASPSPWGVGLIAASVAGSVGESTACSLLRNGLIPSSSVPLMIEKFYDF